MEILKVSSKSRPNAIAGAIAKVIRQNITVEIQVIGAGAINQAIKAIAIARGYLMESNVDLICIPSFINTQVDGDSKTAINLVIEPR